MAPPISVRRREAARMVGVSPRHFDRIVAAGRIPPPVDLGGVRVWRVADLDAAVARAIGPASLPGEAPPRRQGIEL